MRNELSYTLHFRPVGQGLFSHGSLHVPEDPSWPEQHFEWVYDCGAEKMGAHLQNQLFAYDCCNPGDIDLLMLSHFDKDHILGIEKLLQKRNPKVIVVPYIALSQRLACISTLRASDAVFARFLMAPAQYLREIAGDDTRLVFILPGGESPPEQSEGNSAGPNFTWPPRKYPLDEPDERTSDTIAHPEGDPDWQQFGGILIDGGSPFVIRNLWEFCFYNRPRPEMKAPLQARLLPVLEEFENSGKQSADYVDLIQNLKEVFKGVRGPGNKPFDANEISLVVYSGPVARDDNRCFRRLVPSIFPVDVDPRAILFQWQRFPIFPYIEERGRCSTLFTGDITLNNKTMAGIQAHFGADRIGFSAYFQVPHHGSKGSFKMTKFLDFQPKYSIFSSARYRAGYDHPNAGVIARLDNYGPLFVNEFQGFVTGGHLR